MATNPYSVVSLTGQPRTAGSYFTPTTAGAAQNRSFGGMDADTWAAIGMGGAGLLSNYFNNRSADQNADADRQIREREGAIDALTRLMGEDRLRAQIGLDATQLNPYAQQEALLRLATNRALAQQGPAFIDKGSRRPQNQANLGPVFDRFASDPALANAAGNFERARVTASPRTPPLDLGATGLGDAGAGQMDSVNATRQDALRTYSGQADQVRQAVMQALGQPGSNAQPRSPQQAQRQGPSTGQRIGRMALGAGLGYLGARYGGGGMNPWIGAALGGAGGL